MPIQFIPNEDRGGVLGSVGDFLQLMQRNQLVQLQSKQLDLQEQKFKVDSATQQLMNQKVQSELDDKKSVDEYISSMADDHVDNSMPGAPDGYRLLAKGQIKNYATAMAKEHIEQTRAQTQGLVLENQSRGMQLEQLKASQPFFALNAANASAMGTTQRMSAEENLSMQRALSDSQIVAGKGAAAAAWKGAPLSLRQKMAQDNPQIAKYLDTTTLSDDDMMSHIMTEAPDQAPIFFAMKTLGAHGFTPIMSADGTMTTPAEVLASKLGPLFKDLNSKYGKTKSSSINMTTSKGMEEKLQGITKSVEKANDSSEVVQNLNAKHFKFFKKEMNATYGDVDTGTEKWVNSSDFQNYVKNPPEFMDKTNGWHDYSQKEIKAIYKVVDQPDASVEQKAWFRYLLEKSMISKNPNAVFRAFAQEGGSLSPSQSAILRELNKTYQWGMTFN